MDTLNETNFKSLIIMIYAINIMQFCSILQHAKFKSSPTEGHRLGNQNLLKSNEGKKKYKVTNITKKNKRKIAFPFNKLEEIDNLGIIPTQKD